MSRNINTMVPGTFTTRGPRPTAATRPLGHSAASERWKGGGNLPADGRARKGTSYPPVVARLRRGRMEALSTLNLGF